MDPGPPSAQNMVNRARLGAGVTTWKVIKLLLSIALDVLDFTIGRVPGLGVLVDLGISFALACLWGRAGFLHLAEMIDVSEQIDGFVPTSTIIALLSLWADRKRDPRALEHAE